MRVIAIYKPSNFTPSLTEIDVTEKNEFSCQVNTSGDTVKAYKMDILFSGSQTPLFYGPDEPTKLPSVSNKKRVICCDENSAITTAELPLTVPEGTSYYSDTGLTTLVGKLEEPAKFTRLTDLYSEISISETTYYIRTPNYYPQSLVNDKTYQWGVRLYTANPESTAQPTTKVCSGYLTGSTKFVTWLRIPPDLSTDDEDTLYNKKFAREQLVYDRYIEYSVDSNDKLIIGAHESNDKTYPTPNGQVVSTDNPYRSRKKIDWVTESLGVNEDYWKIETEEEFDYDYYDGQEFAIYKCSDEHGVNNFFADPNTNVNVSDFVVLYNSPEEAQEAFNAGDTPDTINSNITPAFDKRKIVGYSSDTGEFRVYDSFNTAPTNGMAYRVFTYDTLNFDWEEHLSSELKYYAEPGINYYLNTLPANINYYLKTFPSGTTYYSDSAMTIIEGQLSTDTEGVFVNTQYSTVKVTINKAAVGTTVYRATLPLNTIYYADPSLTIQLGTLTKETACVPLTKTACSLYVGSTVCYAAVLEESSTIGEALSGVEKSTDSIYTLINVKLGESASYTSCYILNSDMITSTETKYVASVKSGTTSEPIDCTFVNTNYSEIVIDYITYFVPSVKGGIVGANEEYLAIEPQKEKAKIVIDGTQYSVAIKNLTLKLNNETIEYLFDAQVVGGRPLKSDYYTSVSNRWDSTAKRLFLQPNINIKSDWSNPNEIVFENGARVDVIYQYWCNSQTSSGKTERVDITFNKLDDTQWILEDYSEAEEDTENVHTNLSGKTLSSVGGIPPIIPQSDYIVYSDFADTMPYNLFYCYADPTESMNIKCRMKGSNDDYATLNNDDTVQYADIEFVGEYDGQPIRFYKYELYSEEDELLVESENIYDYSLYWYYRGLALTSGTSGVGTYTIKLIIVDEYGKRFEIERAFNVSYVVESTVYPIDIEYDCNAKALIVHTNTPSYVISSTQNLVQTEEETPTFVIPTGTPYYDYSEGNTTFTYQGVTTQTLEATALTEELQLITVGETQYVVKAYDNISSANITNSIIKIPENYLMNYNQQVLPNSSAYEDILIKFPQYFTFATQFQITSDFSDEIISLQNSDPNNNYKEICAVVHNNAAAQDEEYSLRFFGGESFYIDSTGAWQSNDAWSISLWKDNEIVENCIYSSDDDTTGVTKWSLANNLFYDGNTIIKPEKLRFVLNNWNKILFLSEDLPSYIAAGYERNPSALEGQYVYINANYINFLDTTYPRGFYQGHYDSTNSKLYLTSSSYYEFLYVEDLSSIPESYQSDFYNPNDGTFVENTAQFIEAGTEDITIPTYPETTIAPTEFWVDLNDIINANNQTILNNVWINAYLVCSETGVKLYLHQK